MLNVLESSTTLNTLPLILSNPPKKVRKFKNGHLLVNKILPVGKLGKHYRSSKSKELRLRLYIRECKLQCISNTQKGCQRCGETDDSILEFNHIDPALKFKEVTNCSSKKQIAAEVAKCNLLCRSCHRIHTHEHKYKGTSKQARFVNGIKLAIGKCQICERTSGIDNHPYLFDFDHLDPSTKVANVSTLVSKNAKLENIATEIAKCRLLCASCHHRVTIVQNRRHMT